MKILKEVCQTDCKSESRIQNARKLISDEGKIIEIAEKLKLLGNNSRLKIIISLQYGELCVCEIAEIIKLSIPATSQQLKMLRQSNIVRLRNKGKTAYYSLAKPEIPKIINSTFTSIFE